MKEMDGVKFNENMNWFDEPKEDGLGSRLR
jgi:hypothetical protein